MKVLGYVKDQIPGAISPYLPDFIADDIADVDFARLQRMGITYVMLDLDQTLRKPYSKNLEKEVIEVFASLQSKKMFKGVALVTNNSRNLTKYAHPIGASVFQPFLLGGWIVRKPNPLFFRRVMKELRIKPHQAVMIGDKLRTDIVGANKAGIRTILLKPRGTDYWFDHLLLSRLRERQYYRQALSARRKSASTTVHYLKDTLGQAGLPTERVRFIPTGARGSTSFLASDKERSVFVKLVSRQYTAADWALKLWGKLKFNRSEDKTPCLSPKQAMEHEANMTTRARAAGVRVPKIHAIIDLGDYRFALVMQHVEGKNLANLPLRYITDKLLKSIWIQVKLLHKAGIAHRGLRASNIMVRHAQPWIIDFNYAVMPAVKRTMLRDDLELLVTTAAIVGSERAIRNSASALSIEDLRLLLPVLRARHLSRPIRKLLNGKPQLLHDLRQDIRKLTKAYQS